MRPLHAVGDKTVDPVRIPFFSSHTVLHARRPNIETDELSFPEKNHLGGVIDFTRFVKNLLHMPLVVFFYYELNSIVL